jgi:hypothetical protein
MPVFLCAGPAAGMNRNPISPKFPDTIAITLVRRKGYLTSRGQTLVAVSAVSDKIVLRKNKVSSVGPGGRRSRVNSITNVACCSVLGSKNHPVFRVLRTMIELLMIVVRWLVSFGLPERLAARPAHRPLALSAVCVLRRGGYRAIGVSPGIGWMTMRLDPLWCAQESSGPPSARGIRQCGLKSFLATGCRLFSRLLRRSVACGLLGVYRQAE